MRAGLLAAVGVLACAAGAGAAEEDHRLRLQDVPWRVGTPKEVPDRVPQASGDGHDIRIRVSRIWREGPKTHAWVNVRNNSRIEFQDIALDCTAFDVRNSTVARREAMLTRDRYGALGPGFVTDLDFVFDTPKADVRALSCDARGRGLPRRLD